MWPTERASIGVWTDELQARGEPLGEIVALHLRADERRRSGAGLEAARLGREAEDLRLDHAETLLGPLVGELPRLRLRWDLGLVRAIHIGPPRRVPVADAQLILSVLDQLLRRPVVRYLDDIHIDRGYDEELERGLLALLADERCAARPRRVIQGSMPRRFRVLRKFGPARAPTRWGEPDMDLLTRASTRGLTWLGRWGQIQALPWTPSAWTSGPGDHGSRLQALERLLAGPWRPSHERTLARAIWDTSLRVRLRLFAALAELPVEAAPLLVPALAQDTDRRLARIYGDALSRALTRLAGRPDWVEALARNFAASDYWIATWLGAVSRRSRAAAAPALPRVQAMVRRLGANGLQPQMDTLRRAAVALAGPDALDPLAPLQSEGAPRYEDETIAELLSKMGERRRRQI